MALFETPEEVRRRIGKSGMEQDLNLAGMSGAQMANYGGAMAGRLFGQALGGENPEITRARRMQEILQGIDAENPYEGLMSGAKQALQGGLTAEAFELMGAASKLKPKEEKPSAAAKKRDELRELGYDDRLATGLAYGTYRQATDDQGNLHVIDLRRGGQPLPPNEGVEVAINQDSTVVIPGTKVKRDKEKRVEKEIREITDNLVGVGDIGGLDSSLREVEKIIKDIGENDIPGFGITAKAPDFMVSDTGKNLRTAVASIFNRMLKLRSGAAVTEPELKRLMQEFGKGSWKSDDQLRYGLKQARKHLEISIANIASGASPEALKKWNEKAEKMGATLLGERRGMKSFNSVEEAEAANLPKGTIILINGKRAKVK